MPRLQTNNFALFSELARGWNPRPHLQCIKCYRGRRERRSGASPRVDANPPQPQRWVSYSRKCHRKRLMWGQPAVTPRHRRRSHRRRGRDHRENVLPPLTSWPMRPTTSSLMGSGAEPASSVTRSREVTLTMSVNASFSCATMVYVSESARGFYLSWEAIMDLGIVSPNFPSVGAVADPAVTQQPPTRSTERHGSLNAGGLAPTTDYIDSCSCPPRTVVPVQPVALPFECIPANNAKMQEWLLHRFASSTFNTCPHRPLPCMTGPPVEIHLEDGVVPRAMHTAAPVPIHWQEKVLSDLKRD